MVIFLPRYILFESLWYGQGWIKGGIREGMVTSDPSESDSGKEPIFYGVLIIFRLKKGPHLKKNQP